ncbi:RNA-binding protein [Oceanispirochaeta sp.]|uniref:RNA recognition motif domain-containing protein n=1 Tax=Oceanispirochaeta sp. TaxID=2035350 RepID=UPI00260D505F|nr:RNA-binding protein [Oceanispirochaeta sp.]MDA3957221.1 RNA-binding protein [Oceanispirochaeta sp.]
MNDTIVEEVYLGNLSYDITRDDLHEMLEQFGAVSEVNLVENKGIAFVRFELVEDAELAIKSLEGVDFLGRKLVLDWAKPKKATAHI